MNRLIMLTILLVLGLTLVACGNGGSTEASVEATNSNNETAVDQGGTVNTDTTEANTAVSPDTSTETNNPPAALEGDLSLQAQLALGTVKLEDTDLAVDETQAAELLPLWQALQSLSQSDTTADLELQAVVNQIQATMTAEQIAAISAMQLTADSMTDLAENGGLGFGRGAGNGAGNGFPAGGDFPAGGFPGGGIPGGGPGGGGPGGGGFPGGGPGGGFAGGEISEDDIATRQAQFEGNGFGQIQDQMLTGMVTRLLEDKLGIVSEGAARANVMNDAFTAVAEAAGISVEELQNQMAEGQTPATIVQANGGDLNALQAALVELFSTLPNADELDLEQSTQAWLGLQP